MIKVAFALSNMNVNFQLELSGLFELELIISPLGFDLVTFSPRDIIPTRAPVKLTGRVSTWRPGQGVVDQSQITSKDPVRQFRVTVGWGTHRE